MDNRIIIVGAGELGRVTAEICQSMNREVVGYFDDTIAAGQNVDGIPVLGGFDHITDASVAKEVGFLVALGDSAARIKIYEEIGNAGLTLASVKHSNCVISPTAQIGRGVIICTFSYVATKAQVGDFTFLGSRVTVSGDARIGKGVFLAPSSTLLRNVTIEDRAFIGAGAILTPGITIATESVVGAGSVVLDDIPPGVFAVGTPARIIKRLGAR